MNDDLRTSTPRPAQATAREFVAVVFRRKWIVLGLFLITTATVLGISLSTPTTYQSVGRVLIKRGEKQSVLQPQRQMFDWKEELASEIEVIRSQAVVERAQQILDRTAGRGESPVKLRLTQVDVQVLGQSNVVLIAYRDRDPKIAHRGCDALIAAYIEHRKDISLDYPKAFFDGEIARVTRDLNRWETERRNFASGAGVTDFTNQRTQLIQFQMTLRSRLDQLSTEYAEADAERRLMEELSRDADIDVPLLGRIPNEGVLTDLKVKVNEQELKLAQLKERYRDDADDVIAAQATLDALRAMLRREVVSRLKVSQFQTQALGERMQPLRAELERVNTRLAASPAQEARLNEMNREIGVLQDRYRSLVDNSDRALINEQTSSNVWVTLLEPAGPATASNARDYVRLALAPAFSLVVGLGIAFFLDGLDSRLRTPLDVESTLDVPVLASITERRRSQV